MTRPPPYVGVSGITTPEQARAILNMWPASAPPQSLMLGVLTSAKVLAGGERNARSPAPESFASIFQDDPRALNLVHYFTKDPTTLDADLLRCVDGDLCDGAQINVAWPPPEALQGFQRYAPKLIRTVLQIGPKMLADYHYGVVAELVADREYRGLITDVLIDISGGTSTPTSEPIDPRWARKMVEAVRVWNPYLGIGIAGGLCAEALPSVAALVAEHDLSIDAEGKLRNARDELDLGKVRAYLNAAAAMWGWA